jgi:Protein of unknown function with HXXEE motif
MDWIFAGFLAASIVHMVEEYFYPGGFMDQMKRFNPRFAPFVTARMAVIINGLQLVLCMLAILVGRNLPIFGMSIAGLLLINGLMHIGGSVKAKSYTPGVVTGVLFYLPLSIYAYVLFIGSSQLTWGGVIITGMLGLLYQAVPISYLALAGSRKSNLLL